MFRQRRAALLSGLVLLCAFAVFVAAVVVVTQLNGYRQEQAHKITWYDSAGAQLFGFERQLIYLRSAVAAATTHPDATNRELLRERYELFLSRVDILRESTSLAEFREAEHRQLLAYVDELLKRMDALLARPGLDRAQLLAIQDLLGRLAPETQSGTTQVTSATARLIQGQFNNLQRQSNLIFFFATVQLVFVVLAALALNAWRKRQESLQAKQARWAEELQVAKIAAEAGAQAKSRFLANMSHELRTPFQGVLGMLQLLDGTGLDAQQRELVQTARKSAKHLLSVLNDILDVSAIESGKVVLHKEPFQLRKLCVEIEALMSVQALARSVPLEMAFPPELPAWVVGDATRIKQVLFNLLSNAIKFAPEGRVRLEMQARRGEGDQWSFEFVVEDTGIGMSPDVLVRLFRRFEQGDMGISKRFGGTGLGLEISNSLARMMQGSLSVTSVEGKGSRFVFLLPLHECPAPPVTETSQRPVPRSGLQILVADDNPVNRRYLEVLLRRQGQHATLCQNGQEALEVVQTQPFDVVLLDVHMPVMDGLSATRAIRALDGPVRNVPIVSITADVMPGSVESCLEAGATAFVSKPIQVGELTAILARVTARNDDALTLPASLADASPDSLAELRGRLTRERLAELLEMFFSEAPASVARLREAIAADDPRLAALAHGLKASASVVGVEAVAELAGRIERAAGQPRDPAALAALAEQLEPVLAQEHRRATELLAPPQPAQAAPA